MKWVKILTCLLVWIHVNLVKRNGEKHGTTAVNVLFFVQYFKDVDYDDNWTSERWLDLVFF